jgi:hypothetical protein
MCESGLTRWDPGGRDFGKVLLYLRSSQIASEACRACSMTGTMLKTTFHLTHYKVCVYLHTEFVHKPNDRTEAASTAIYI